jgi:cyclohexyl-isocyanide hydratase
MTSSHPSLHIGAIIFPAMDQADLTGPFEVLARIPGSSFHILSNDLSSVRDVHGFIITPEKTLQDAPQLDVLVVPGGSGQEGIMDDEAILEFIRQQAKSARYIFSVCTGALICGAAGLLRGTKATTHWSAFHLLEYFGAIPTPARVVVDGKQVSTAGVTAGFDGALRVTQLLCGDQVAQTIQLAIEYAPNPPFNSGSPDDAPAEVLASAHAAVREITKARLRTAQRISARLGIRTERLNQEI